MTGTPASEVWQMGGVEFAAFAAEAADAAWTPTHEMVALQTEILHGIYRLLIGTLTKSNPPDQLRIPRPGDPGKRRLVVSAGDMARALTRRGGVKR